MCSASRTGLSRRWAVAWAATIASWAFSVKRSSCMWLSLECGSRSARSGLLDDVEERRAAAVASSGRSVGSITLALDVQVAMAVGLEAGHSLAGQPEGVRRLWVPAGIFSRTLPLERLHPDLGAEERLLDRQR